MIKIIDGKMVIVPLPPIKSVYSPVPRNQLMWLK